MYALSLLGYHVDEKTMSLNLCDTISLAHYHNLAKTLSSSWHAQRIQIEQENSDATQTPMEETNIFSYNLFPNDGVVVVKVIT